MGYYGMLREPTGYPGEPQNRWQMDVHPPISSQLIQIWYYRFWSFLIHSHCRPVLQLILKFRAGRLSIQHGKKECACLKTGLPTREVAFSVVKWWQSMCWKWVPDVAVMLIPGDRSRPKALRVRNPGRSHRSALVCLGGGWQQRPFMGWEWNGPFWFFSNRKSLINGGFNMF